jgi:tRNA(Ile)-lysidine synthase
MNPTELQAHVCQFFVEQADLTSDDLVVLGVSGGVDSMTLADASVRVAQETGIRFCIAHFDHGLRANSDVDARFVQQYAGSNQVQFLTERSDVGVYASSNNLGIEEAARELRYRFLVKVKNEMGGRFVAVAHNQDDQAETVLMRLMRGAGLRGLRAMIPVGDSIIRPLLKITRKDIQSYADELALTYRTDSTNTQLITDRNRIRLDVMPLLENIRPGVKSVLARTAATLGKDLEVIEWAAREVLGQCRSREFGEVLELCWADMEMLPDGVIAALFRLISEERCGVLPTKIDIDSAISFCRNLKSSGTVKLGSALWLLGSSGWLAFSPDPKCEMLLETETELPIPGGLKIPKAGVSISTMLISEPNAVEKSRTLECYKGPNRSIATLDFDRMLEPIVVRGRKQGDVFTPFGHTSAIQLDKFLGRHNIPSWRRNAVPLVVANGQVAWVPGIEIGDCFRVGPDSRRLLRLSMKAIAP